MKKVFVADLAEGEEFNEAFAVRDASLRDGEERLALHRRDACRPDGDPPVQALGRVGGGLQPLHGLPCIRVRGRIESYPPGSGKLQAVVRQARPPDAGRSYPADFAPARRRPRRARARARRAGRLRRRRGLRRPRGRLPRSRHPRRASSPPPRRPTTTTPSGGAPGAHGLRRALGPPARGDERAALARPPARRRAPPRPREDRGDSAGASPGVHPAGGSSGTSSSGAMLVEKKIAGLGGPRRGGAAPPPAPRSSPTTARGSSARRSCPAIPEAFALNHLDNLDAKVEAARWQIERDASADENFTEYSKMLGVRLYKGRPKTPPAPGGGTGQPAPAGKDAAGKGGKPKKAP